MTEIYADGQPRDCCACYYYEKKIGCTLKRCYYLIDDKPKKKGECDDCPRQMRAVYRLVYEGDSSLRKGVCQMMRDYFYGAQADLFTFYRILTAYCRPLRSCQSRP